MKKTMFLIFGMFFFILAGCNGEKNLENYIDGNEPIPITLTFEIVDGEGRNLLHPNTQGNIRNNEIKAYHAGHIHEVRDLMKVPYKNVFYMDETYLYCSCLTNDVASKQEVVIDWDNNRRDTIEIKFAHNESLPFWLNGEIVKGKYPGWIKIVMN